MKEKISPEEKIENLENLINSIQIEIEIEKSKNIEKGNKLLIINLLMGLTIGLVAYFLLDATYKYLMILCIIAIILIIIIFIRVKYVVDNLEKFKLIIINDLKKQIDEFKKQL